MAQPSIPAPRVAPTIDAPTFVFSDGTHLCWDELYSDLGPALLAYARSRGVRDPEDLVQDVFVDVYRYLDEFTGDLTGLRSLLFTIAFRRIADHYRRSARRPEMLVSQAGDTVAMSTGPSGVEDEVVSSETVSAAFRALSILTERERQVIRMRVFAEESPAEVSRLLGLTNINVRVIQARAFSKLRAFLEAEGHLHHPLIVMLAVSSLRHFNSRLPSSGILGDWVRDVRAAAPRALRPPDVVGSLRAIPDDSLVRTQLTELGSSVAPALLRIAVVASAVAIGAAGIVVTNPLAVHSPLPDPEVHAEATAPVTELGEASDHQADDVIQEIDTPDPTGEPFAGTGTHPARVGVPSSRSILDHVGTVGPVTGILELVVADADAILIGLVSSLAEQLTDRFAVPSASETLANGSATVTGVVEVTIRAADAGTADVVQGVDQMVDGSPVERVVAAARDEISADSLEELGETVENLSDGVDDALADVAAITDSVVDDGVTLFG